ncbi:hypothetical protein BD626DRAFT_537138 [Schizophyllum amplum]|uniref:DUF7729 domain-containing protein n=1 Tax=Schizophyllum amplum TaxID=97359 RepID=A0A550CEJ5_9AGAR|nr:hypothetical protein BD626DRAFT_537138 [Auriculariopsis ampla]
MMKSLAILALLSSAAWAQSSASQTASAGSSLPTDDASKSCRKFLKSLDSDSTLSDCIAPLISASAAFAPGGSGSSGQVQDTLETLCKADGCDASTVQGKLADFYAACSDELTSGNEGVIEVYDAMYAISPLKTAMCSKGDNGDYCMLSMSKYADSDDVQAAQQALSSESSAANGTAFSAYNIPFLFLTGSVDSNYLCTTCTRNILAAYIDYESDSPYAPGLSASQLISGQMDLYSGVVGQCGSSFLSGAVQAAGGLKDDSPFSGNGASHAVSDDVRGLSALALAASALVLVL